MARILVIGSGFAGLSAAARLAKLRHDVTVLERESEPGGRLLGLRIGEDRWAAGPESVTLPGVFRDLFRKSGRPMDALVTISPAGPRQHLLPARWPRKSVTFDLPFGTRGAQHDAVTAALGRDEWSPWLDELASPWNALRRGVLEAVHTDSPVEVPLGTSNLAAYARQLRDSRLRRLVIDQPGVDPTQAPAAIAVWNYVERNFGRWTFDGGSAGLAAALVTRLRERKVTIETNMAVELPPGEVVEGVLLADGSVRPADVVVWAAGAPADSPDRALTAVKLQNASLPDDFIVHGRSVVRGWRSGENRWVIESPASLDPLDELARHGLDVRAASTWRGVASAPATLDQIPRPARSPRPGLWLVGGAAVPGASLEITGMGTAALAGELGPVPR